MIIKRGSDKEKVKSIIKMIKDREDFLKNIDIKKFPGIFSENFYEIIKELATTILLVEGFKSVGENAYRDLINFLSRYKEFTDEEIFLMNDLRIRRNQRLYEGKDINLDYLLNKKDRLKKIVQKLKKILKAGLK